MIKFYGVNKEIADKMRGAGIRISIVFNDVPNEICDIKFESGLVKCNNTCHCVTIDQGGKIFTMECDDFQRMIFI